MESKYKSQPLLEVDLTISVYKKSDSIFLVGITNANYEFLMYDIKTNGRVSDSVIENEESGRN